MKATLLALTACLIMPFCNTYAIGTQAIVKRVVDGDTIDVLLNNKTIRVRFQCLDAPELKQTFKGRAIGTEAKLRMQNLLHENDAINIITINQDNYGRTVGYVYKNGLNVNEDALQNGFGVAYKQYCNTKQIAIEADAKQNKRGLWAYGEYQNPKEYRDNKKKKAN